MSMQFPAGARTPDKYSTVGPNYQKWGEQEHNGYVYNPATDTYYYDPKAAAKWNAETNKELEDEYGTKQPSIWEQSAAAALPVAATVGGVKLAENLPSLLSGGGGLLSLGGGGAGSSFTAQSLLGGGGAAAAVPDSAAATEALFAAGGGAGTSGTGTGLLGLSGNSTLGAVAPYALPAAGALMLGDTLMKDRGKTSNALRGGLAGGLAAAPFMAALGPVGIGAAILGGGLLGLGGGGLLRHKSTKDVQAERQQELIDRGITGYADFAAQLPTSAEDDPNYGKVPVMSALKAEDVWGSNGVFDTFGNDWLGKYTGDQRRQIAQRLLDEGLFDSDKGDIVIFSENQDRARQIKDEILGTEEEEKDDATV